jgi:hypothetical protein
MLTGGPINSPSRASPIPSSAFRPQLDMHALRITAHTQLQTPCYLFYASISILFIRSVRFLLV